MTIALAIKARDGILVAADKRELSSAFGLSQSDSALKIKRIGCDCLIALAGRGGMGVTVLERFARANGYEDRAVRADCLEVADALQAAALADKAAQQCSFLVCGYMRDDGRRAPCIKKLQSTLGFYPEECAIGTLVAGSVGHGWFLPYCQKLLRDDLGALSVAQLVPTVAFIIQETASITPEVGPTFDLYHLRENVCELVADHSLAGAAAARLRLEIVRAANDLLLPSTASQHQPD